MEILYNAIVYLIWFLGIYFVVFMALNIFSIKHTLKSSKPPLQHQPSVSIIVPAYNEAEKIHETIQSLQTLNYTNYKVIIINDGSSDNTSHIVQQHIKNKPLFTFIDRKENKGKAASLNEGILHTDAEYIVTIDADSVIEQDLLQKALPHFDAPDIGAVTVSVRVHKPKGILHRIFQIEFMIGLSLFLKTLAHLNSIFVTPGPCSIYRRDALIKIGLFDVNNITEDHEIAFRLHKHGYKIQNCFDAHVSTILPPTFKQIYRQRRRWYSGSIQTVFKHKDMLFKKKYGLFGFIIPFNYALIFTGMFLFGYSIYLMLRSITMEVRFIMVAGWDWSRILEWNFDILRMSTVQMFGLTGLLSSIVFLAFALIITRQSIKHKKLGILGYPALYILYNIFWLGAVIAVIKGKKISWR